MKHVITRRKVLGGLLFGAGAVLSGCGLKQLGNGATRRGKILLGHVPDYPPGLETAATFPLLEAIQGRRARRFSLGASIANGPFTYTSTKDPVPLSDLEQMIVLLSVAGNTGWQYLIPHNPNYKSGMPNYAGTAGGRTFPSSAGFHTTEFFYTDDHGVYFLPTRDAPSLMQRDDDGSVDLQSYMTAHKARIRKLSDGRLHIPPKPAHIEAHNPWCMNRSGSTLIIPVADLAQHQLLTIAYLVKNGACMFDDVNKRPIPGMDKFRHLVDVDNPYPLTYVEQLSMMEATAEVSTACYAGMLTLQAMGLGGWMFDGITPLSILGASGDPEMPGLGFRYDTDARWPLPNVTGLPGVFEGFCPPHYPDMHAATKALIKRKFGNGGPFNPETPGPYRDTARVRGAGEPFSEDFTDCVVTMAQYVFDTFGKFPGTVPSMLILTYLQAHHLDLEFYDKFYQPGAYLETHARHMEMWHGK